MAARHFGADTPLPSLETHGRRRCDAACGPGAAGCGFGGTTAFRTPFQPLPMEDNPRKVFYQLFGQGDTADERKRDPRRDRQHARLRARGNAPQLKQALGAADRARVSDYLDSVREVERRVQKLADSKGCEMELPNAPLGVPEEFAEQLDVHVRHDRAGLPGQPDARGRRS